MNIKKHFQIKSKQPDEATCVAARENIYFQSKLLWNNLYGDIETKLENAYRIIAILAGVIMLAIIGFIVIAGQSRVQPYVAVLHNNDLLTVTDVNAVDAKAFKPKLALMMAKQFIQASRTVSVDRQINQNNRLKAYAFVRGAAAKRLGEYYEKHNPDTLARNAIHSVQITTLLRKSEKTLDIRWQEEVRSRKSGEIIESRPYSAEMTFDFDKTSGNRVIAGQNPLGFYIDQLVWAEDVR